MEFVGINTGPLEMLEVERMQCLLVGIEARIAWPRGEAWLHIPAIQIPRYLAIRHTLPSRYLSL